MRTDYDPQSVKRRAWREAASHAAHGLMFGFGYLPNRHRPERSRDIRTQVFVHGYGGNRAGFFPLQTYLRLHRYNRQLSFNYRTAGSIEGMAVDLKERINREVRGGQIDLICHSMGGLVARYYLQLLGGHRRVQRLITLGTPHHGTYPSNYLPTPLLYQFIPDGSFLEHLNAQPPPAGVQCHSFAAEKDLVVLPASSALAPFGSTETFDGLGHLDILLSGRVFRAVRSALDS